jgi:hypothetical protein
MSPNPTQPVKKATKGMAKLLPLSLGTRIRLLLARLWAKLKSWRLRRRVRNV